MIADETVTVWHRVRVDIDHAGWERTVVDGCRFEGKRGAGASNPQARVDDSASLYVFRDSPIGEGDMVAEGTQDGNEPPAGALRVTSVRIWPLHGRFHHMEVECR